MRSSNGPFRSFSARPVSSGSPSFYFRRVVPRDLRQAFGGRREVRFSLGTADKQVAYQRWLMTSFRWNELVILARELLSMGHVPHIPGIPESLSEALEEQGRIRPWTVRKDPGSPHVTVTLDARRENLQTVLAELRQVASTEALTASPIEVIPNEISGADSVPSVRPTSPVGPALHSSPTDRPEIGLSFREVATKFLAVKQGNWSHGVRKDYQAILRTVEELLGNAPFASIEETRIGKLKDDLQLMPARRAILPQYRTLSLMQVLEIQAAKKRQGTLRDSMAPATFNKYWQVVEMLFGWAAAKKYTANNYAEGMQIEEEKGGRRNNKRRLAFTKEDLRKIFESGRFAPGGYRYDYQYWGPVLSHYLGTRVSEIGAIPLIAVKRSPRGTVYVEFFVEHGFDPKTVWGERRVPLHRNIAESLWSVAEARRARGEKYLLSSMYDGQPDPGRPIGRYVNEILLPKVGVKTKQKVEHSFRHVFINLCKDSRIDGGLIDELVGHSPTSTKGQNYEELTDIDVLGEAINEVDFVVTIPPYEYKPRMDRVRARKRKP